MIRLFVIAFVAIICVHTAVAQRIFPMGVGFFVSGKAGIISASIPEGAKTRINFNSLPDFGAVFYMPLTRRRPLGVSFDVGHSAYSYGTKVLARFDNDNNVQIPDLFGFEQFGFFLAGANLCYGPITLGFGVGFPQTAKSVRDTVTLSPGSAKISVIEKNGFQDKLNSPLFEGRFGVMVPLVFNRTGRLNLTVQGTYAFTKMYQRIDDYFLNRDVYGNVMGWSYIPSGAALSIGLNYLFSLQKM